MSNDKNIIPMERWPSMLPLYMAEHESSAGLPLYTVDEIAEHFGITVADIMMFSEQLAFREEVLASKAELKDKNSIVRQKAKAQLETYMDNLIPKWMLDEDFPPAEKTKLMKFLQEVAETGGSTAEKAKSKLNEIPDKGTNLNIYITAPNGETKPATGVTIVQEPEETKKVEKPDAK